MKKIVILVTLVTALIAPLQFVSAVNTSGLSNNTENPFSGLSMEVIKKIIDLSPREFEKLTGKHLSLKEKISFKILKWKLKRDLKHAPEKMSNGKFEKMARMSMIFGIGAFIIAFLPFGSFLAIPSALLAIILGAVSIKKVEKKTNSIIGIVLGSAFLVLLLIAIAVFVSIFSHPWY